jgi:hypothetical protein
MSTKKPINTKPQHDRQSIGKIMIDATSRQIAFAKRRPRMADAA